jgi:hypothetical protein
MVDQYKLRLGDGTVLAVDEQGLRAWVLDAKAMVQRPGSSAWRPLPEVLAAIDDGIPIIPFKPEPADAPAPATPPSGDLREIAAAALDPAGLGDRPQAETASRADVKRPAPVAPPAVGPTAGPKPFIPDPKGREVQVRQGPVDPRTIVYPPVPGEVAVRTALEWSGAAASQAGKLIASLPPPSLPKMAQPLASPEGRRRVLVPALAVAAALALGFGAWSVWSRTQAREAAATAAVPSTLPPPPPTVPELPKEVQEAMVQLPHLSADTIQRMMAAGADARDSTPPELFRRAYLAATRGTAALTEDEARELNGLMNGVLGNLRRVDRDRVRAYGRLHNQRDLLVDEDRKVLALFARGVRALPAPRRERLQQLSARAIASGLPNGSPDPAPGATAAP